MKEHEASTLVDSMDFDHLAFCPYMSCKCHFNLQAITAVCVSFSLTGCGFSDIFPIWTIFIVLLAYVTLLVFVVTHWHIREDNEGKYWYCCKKTYLFLEVLTQLFCLFCVAWFNRCYLSMPVYCHVPSHPTV